jgi:cytochrome P450
MATARLPSTCPHSAAPLASSVTSATEIATPSVVKVPRPSANGEPDISRDMHGVWHIRDFRAARQILRSRDTVQAGFKAGEITGAKTLAKVSVLYQDGEPHLLQRRATGHLFSPRVVEARYRKIMEHQADLLVAELRERKQLDLSKISLTMAVRVAIDVVGLQQDRSVRGVVRRMERFFDVEVVNPGWRPRQLIGFLRMQIPVLKFFLLDVLPAVRARRKAPRDDIVSHLLRNGRNAVEILTECMTYATAGMVTTREFISVVTWHLLGDPDTRARYLAADREERYAILHELLRLEPVIGHLQRRAIADIKLSHNGETYHVPAGALMNIHLHDINTDTRTVGEDPFLIRPGREANGTRIAPEVMSFGDGNHRCPGAYIAVQEADVLLGRLLLLPGLRIVRTPRLGWNDIVDGYELRDFTVAVD